MVNNDSILKLLLIVYIVHTFPSDILQYDSNKKFTFWPSLEMLVD